ncbi:hypothetical protein BH23BAC1_BH23BAC1_26780 [soil metagenome]
MIKISTLLALFFFSFLLQAQHIKLDPEFYGGTVLIPEFSPTG